MSKVDKTYKSPESLNNNDKKKCLRTAITITVNTNTKKRKKKKKHTQE
jgi:hypothetical protein